MLADREWNKITSRACIKDIATLHRSVRGIRCFFLPTNLKDLGIFHYYYSMRSANILRRSHALAPCEFERTSDVCTNL